MRGVLRTFVVLLLLAGLGAAAVAWWFVQGLDTPYRGFTGAEQFVEIPPGSSTQAIGRTLAAAGVVSDELTFRIAVMTSHQGARLQAGEYRFAEALTPRAVIERLARGDVFVRRITFPEGLTVAEMAALFAQKGFGTAADFRHAAANAAPIRDLDPEAPDLEGYLFPETYTLPRSATAEVLVARMVQRFRAVADEAFRARAAGQGLTLRQAVSLAALVEKETADPAERPLVAAVYRNRLRIGMPMQADPTLIYALVRAGRYDGNIHKADLQFDSRYNTYRYPGLPPGPIAAPGRASLEAAVAPADVAHLYFVSRNDGTHVFAATLPEHNRNVQQFQVRYFREKRQAAAREAAREAAVTRTARRGSR